MRQQWVGKRQAERTKVQLRAELRFGGSQPEVDCILTDVSLSGARLTLVEDADLPDEFEVFVFARNETRWARLRWHEKKSIGIEFLTREGVDANVLHRLSALEARLSDVASPPPSGAPVSEVSAVAPGALAFDPTPLVSALAEFGRRLRDVEAICSTQRSESNGAADELGRTLQELEDACVDQRSALEASAGKTRALADRIDVLDGVVSRLEERAAEPIDREPATSAEGAESGSSDARLRGLETSMSELRAGLRTLVMLTAARIKQTDSVG
jgi:hypothetical protein